MLLPTYYDETIVCMIPLKLKVLTSAHFRKKAVLKVSVLSRGLSMRLG